MTPIRITGAVVRNECTELLYWTSFDISLPHL